jgi:hypothetical protein
MRGPGTSSGWASHDPNHCLIGPAGLRFSNASCLSEGSFSRQAAVMPCTLSKAQQRWADAWLARFGLWPALPCSHKRPTCLPPSIASHPLSLFRWCSSSVSRSTQTAFTVPQFNLFLLFLVCDQPTLLLAQLRVVVSLSKHSNTLAPSSVSRLQLPHCDLAREPKQVANLSELATIWIAFPQLWEYQE